MAAHRDERAAQSGGHVLDKTGFATPRGPFDEHRQFLLESMGKQGRFAALFGVVGGLLLGLQVAAIAVVPGVGSP